MASAIEWLDGGETWNPIKARRKSDGKKGWACVRISPGCEHCYSEKQNVQCGTNPTRHGTGLKYTVPSLDQVELYLDEEVLMQPLHWKKGRLIFPCSMTDWMADFVPDEWRDKMLAVMALTPQHTYLTLTKRADRQREYMTSHGDCSHTTWTRVQAVHSHVDRIGGQLAPLTFPLPNLWLGTSTESQPYADSRIPLLLQTPAAVRWISAEPLLGEICIERIPRRAEYYKGEEPLFWKPLAEGLNWVVAGGESGPNARPMHPDWARSLRDQCQAAGVPFFFKQHGEWMPVFHGINPSANDPKCRIHDGFTFPAQAGDPEQDGRPIGQHMWKVGKKAAGRLLDGKEHSEYPVQRAEVAA